MIERISTRSVMVVAVALGLVACAGHTKTLTLHAPEHRSLHATQVRAGTMITCVTHGQTIKGRAPATSGGGSNTSADYDGRSGGILSIETKGSGIVMVVCS
jgi:hypothetical protein